MCGLPVPQSSIAADWTSSIPFVEYLVVEAVIGAITQQFDIRDIKIKTNLVIDVEIAQIGNRQLALQSFFHIG
jgi:hypothetical protein